MQLSGSEPALIEDDQLAAARQLGQLDPAYAQFRDQTRFWVQRVAVPMIMVVGLFGNLITVIIMTRRRMRSTTNLYLAALAFVDMLYLVLTFLLGLSHYPNVARRRYYPYWKLKPFLMMLTDSCSNTSVWLTVTFTIERFIAVRYPIKGKVWCTEARAKRLIVCVFVFAVLFALPTPFEWNVVERRVAGAPPEPPDASANVSDMTGDKMSKLSPAPFAMGPTRSMPSLDKSPISNEAGELGRPVHELGLELEHDEQLFLALEYSDFGSNDTYKTIYYWSTAAIFYFIPLLSLTFFNGFLIHSVHQSRRERNKMTNQRASAARASAFDRNRVAVADSKAEFSISKKKSFQLKRGGNAALIAQLVPRAASDTFPEVEFKVIGELARDRDDNPQADSAKDSSGRAFLKNQQTDCDKGDSKLLSGAFVPLSGPVTSFPRAADQQQSSTVQAACSQGPVAARSGHEKECADEAITRLYLASAYNSARLEDGSPKGSLTERAALEVSSSGGSTATPLAPSRRSQLVSLDRSSTNNHSSRSSCNEAAPPANQQNTMAPASSQERRITIMLISVVILFLVCQIPTAAMLLYTSVHETIPNTNEQALQLALGNIFNFLMAVNAAGNFILYSFLSKKYRRTFVILFCGCLRRAAPSERHTDDSRRTKESSCLSNAHRTGKNCPTTINTSRSAVYEAPRRPWASMRLSKVPRAPPVADTKHVLIHDKDEPSRNHLIKAEKPRRRDTLV